ncbi:YceI family protein [Kibdelosporangium phytohabitans]|uniref:Lipid/polyisoprenoid-binding YceI-like domain-containing protein n=1 Tax=Kibdelosporangium phytohabitans TaxID=860235 RepID=A0A0N9HZJ1_9PSEU|nr:YceI family protein [Kibdelosporangium phytohabitans]ALG08811.1 hypothetical protein AOZ06_19510 [Kibdelosporangium phytohabitans]MBE1470049.1 polyisoprenoid-binding protein YceI [Kibdelosporangium phytohabitans]
MTTALTLAAGTWTADPATSTAGFAVGSLGGTVHATVPIVDGRVEVGSDGTPTAVHGSLDLGAIATGNRHRDKHLRSPGLLDLDTHPTMTFRAIAITVADEGWHVTGELTVRGFICPLEGDVHISTSDFGAVSMTATTRFDRRQMSLRAPRFMIGRIIEITVTANLDQVAVQPEAVDCPPDAAGVGGSQVNGALRKAVAAVGDPRDRTVHKNTAGRTCGM